MKELSIVALVGFCLIAGLSARADTYIRKNDLAILQSYYNETNFPATPGEAMTYYEPGTVLPEKVTYTEMPDNVTRQLTATPPGEEYVIIDRNYYLIDHDKRLVIDAVRNQ